MDELEYRTLLKFFILESFLFTEIDRKLVMVHEECSFVSNYQEMGDECVGSLTIFENNQRDGLPQTVTTNENIEKVNNINFGRWTLKGL